MLDNRFYWGTIRKAVVAFGNIFNSITIERRDGNGTQVQLMKVPLSYAPKQKFLTKIRQQPNIDNQSVQIVLPRMSFEMLSIDYDPNRKVSPLNQSRTVNSSTSASAAYAPTPYNLNMLLYVYAKNQDDGLQILEQILPYFNPDYNLSMKMIPELNLTNDVMVLLNSIGFEDDYEGDVSTRRSIVWTLNFVMKLNFYGPVTRQGIIKKVVTTTYDEPDLSNRQQRMIMELPANTLPTSNYTTIDSFEDF